MRTRGLARGDCMIADGTENREDNALVSTEDGTETTRKGNPKPDHEDSRSSRRRTNCDLYVLTKQPSHSSS